MEDEEVAGLLGYPTLCDVWGSVSRCVEHDIHRICHRSFFLLSTLGFSHDF
jgi:hypothetical protein